MRTLSENMQLLDWLQEKGLNLAESTYVLKWVNRGLNLEEALIDILCIRDQGLKLENFLIDLEKENVDWGNPITP